MIKFFLKAWLVLVLICIVILFYDDYKKEKQREYERSLPKQPEWDTATSPTYQELMRQLRKFEERHKHEKLTKQKNIPVQDSLTKEQIRQREWIEDEVESEIENRLD